MRIQSQPEKRLITLGAFDQTVNSFTLNFKDPHLEELYRKRRLDPLEILVPFKLLFISLVTLVGVRGVELLCLYYAKVDTTLFSETTAYANIISLGVTCLVEFLAYFVRGLRPIRGCMAIVHVFFIVPFSTSQGPHNQASSPPL